MTKQEFLSQLSQLEEIHGNLKEFSMTIYMHDVPVEWLPVKYRKNSYRERKDGYLVCSLGGKGESFTISIFPHEPS